MQNEGDTLFVPKDLRDKLKLNAKMYGFTMTAIYGILLDTFLKMTEKNKELAFKLLTENSIEYTTKECVKIGITIDKKTQDSIKMQYPMLSKSTITVRLFVWFIKMTDEEKRQLLLGSYE